MTNALAQNIQANENSSAIDAIMQAASINTLPKAEEHGDFSNIINNLESKTQKLQSDFDKKAKVTNTSSINQKALDKKETITPKETEKNTWFLWNSTRSPPLKERRPIASLREKTAPRLSAAWPTEPTIFWKPRLPRDTIC